MITHKELLDNFRYSPDTGKFQRKFKKGWRHTGCLTRGYRVIMFDGVSYQAHRLAWLYIHGDMPKGEIDHINHVKDDNRIENLRDVSHHQNRMNSSKRSDNSSGVNGVSWYRRDSTWQLSIKVNCKSIYLGRFTSKTEAIAARKAAEVEHGFHANHGQ